MGLGDFAKGIGEAVGNVGEAIGGDFIVDKIQDIPEVVETVGNVGEGIVKGVSHLATNPTQIARGAGAAINFVQENPGKVWDVGFEVGRSIVKDQLDPVNLAITAGLVGLTVATGGAAAPALVGKLAMGAKSAGTAIKAGEGAIQGVRAARSGWQAASAASTAVRTARAADTAIDTVKTIDRASDAAKTISRGDAFLGGTNTAREATTLSKVMNPVSRHVENFMQNKVRDPLATRILQTSSGAEAGFGRQAAAALVQGNTGNMPTVLAGQSAKFATVQQNMWRGRQVARKTIGYSQTAEAVEEGYDIAADPAGYAEGKAREHQDEAVDFARQHEGEINQFAQQHMPQQPKEKTGPGGVRSYSNPYAGYEQATLDMEDAPSASQYGPKPDYSAGRGFRTPASVDWSRVVPA